MGNYLTCWKEKRTKKWMITQELKNYLDCLRLDDMEVFKVG